MCSIFKSLKLYLVETRAEITKMARTRVEPEMRWPSTARVPRHPLLAKQNMLGLLWRHSSILCSQELILLRSSSVGTIRKLHRVQ